jgi:hypothetical protein
MSLAEAAVVALFIVGLIVAVTWLFRGGRE